MLTGDDGGDGESSDIIDVSKKEQRGFVWVRGGGVRSV